jgi:hypothetical protein
LDFSVGDYISNLHTDDNPIITKIDSDTGKPVPIGLGTYSLTIVPSYGTDIEVVINSNSQISGYNYINQGYGVSHSKPPKVSLEQFFDFKVDVGIQYTAELREGQYVIGGNPQFQTSTHDLQSWVPSNLLNEIESAMSYAILKDSSYCYKRKPWTAEKTIIEAQNSTTDYPLLFTARLMSQYPSIESYTGSQDKADNFETNSCKFNRIYTTNCLIFRSNILPVGIFSDNTDGSGFKYSIRKYDTINVSGSEEYILYCKLENPLDEIVSQYWTGLNSDYLNLAHWEFLYASGEYQIVNSATLLGYNKKNYNISTNTNAIEVHTINDKNTTLIPSGLTYSSENDYYMFGDPEYVVLSFRPKYGGSTIAGINDRVDSQPNTNIDRVFACLIFDTVQPAVLQDVSSGKNDVTYGSLGDENNQLNSFIKYGATGSNGSGLQDVKQLAGNSGSQNVSYNKSSGQLKAMKGADFDRKVIDFPQPVAQISNINIRFSKFSNLGHGNENELYNFHGKEHLLLFEITCGDLMTGRRF